MSSRRLSIDKGSEKLASLCHVARLPLEKTCVNDRYTRMERLASTS